MRKAISRILAGVSLGAVSILLSAEASAQSLPPPPQPVNVDENGVDLGSRELVLSDTDLAIGPGGHRGLQLGRQLATYGWRISTTPVMSGNSTDPIIVVGGSSYSFHWNGSAYISAVQDGSTLNSAATQFTAADGTLIDFQSVQDLTEHASAFKAATKITFPDGVEHTFSYQTGWQEVVFPDPQNNYFVQSTRLISVNSTTGYQLKPSYLSNTSSHWNWRQLTGVTSINNAVEFCSPTADTCSLTGNWPQVTYGSALATTSSVTDPEGRSTVYTYSGQKVASITPPGSGSSPVSFTYSSNLVASVTKGGGTWTYTTPQSAVTQVAGPNSQSGVHGFDSNGFLISQDLGSGAAAFEYCNGTSTCPAGRVEKITSPEDNYTVFAYDARGNLTSQTYHPKPTTGLTAITKSATYPASPCSNIKTCNKPTSVTDARLVGASGNVTDLTWDTTHGGLTQIQAPAPSSGAARPTTTISYAQVQARYLTGTSTWSNSPVIYAADLVRSCPTAATCVGNGSELVRDFDYLAASVANNALVTGATTRTGDNGGVQSTAIVYTQLGDVESVDGPLSGTGDKAVSFYNKARQQTGAIGPLDSSLHMAQRVSYDTAGRAWKVEIGSTSAQTSTALAGMTAVHSSVTAFDTYGRPITQSAVGSGNVTYSLVQTSYDSSSRPTCSTVRMNPATFASLPGDACTLATQGSSGDDRISKFTYDAMNRVTKLTRGFDTASAADEYSLTFTDNGRLATAKDAEDNLTSYLYDGHDRNVEVRYPVATKGANASSTTDYEQYGFDANGNVTSFRTRRGETLSLAYDNLGRLLSKTVPQRTGLSTTHTRDVYYTYDLLGQRETVRFDSTNGEGAYYLYDGLGRVVYDYDNMNWQATSLSSWYSIDNARTNLQYPDSTMLTFTIDNLGRRISLYEPGIWLSNHGYDALGRESVVARKDYVNTYRYFDTAGRNWRTDNWDVTAGAYSYWEYTHNPAGQIASRQVSNDAFAFAGHANVDRNYSSNGLNQYTAAGSATICHDANGNLIGDGTFAYLYDVENRLVEMRAIAGSGCSIAYTGQLKAALRYDPLGRLHEVENYISGVAQGPTRFRYDGADLVAEYNAAGTILRRFAHWDNPGTDDPAVWWEGSGVGDSARRFLVPDERGSIVQVTGASGATLAKNTYDEYGIPGSGNLGRFQYTGQVWLPEIGMYYYKARMYSPTLGRFMQTDPIGYGDGMNMYRYVGGDPVNAIDPSGHSCTITNKYRIAGYVTVAGGDPVPQWRSDGVEISGDCGGGVPNVTPDGSGGGDGGGGPSPGQPQSEPEGDVILVMGVRPRVSPPPSTIMVRPPIIPRPSVPFPRGTGRPGPGFEWRGNGPPGSPQGSWYNPKTGEVLRPDLQHPRPIGPHHDYRAPDGTWYRWFGPGNLQPKAVFGPMA